MSSVTELIEPPHAALHWNYCRERFDSHATGILTEYTLEQCTNYAASRYPIIRQSDTGPAPDEQLNRCVTIGLVVIGHQECGAKQY